MSAVKKPIPRTIKRQVAGRPAVDGAGVRLVRVLGSPTVRDFDPFLMLDAFDSENPDDYIRGFPLHPHRGIETVTYLAEGRIEHQDSLGNKGVIVGGGCQWMTAGRGILHQEMPQPAPRMLGLQLWVNLAAKDKMVPPKYRDIRPEDVVQVREPGALVRVLSGKYKGLAGAMWTDYVPVTFLDISLEPGARLTVETRPEDTVFAYMLYGECGVGPVPGDSSCSDKGRDKGSDKGSDKGGGEGGGEGGGHCDATPLNAKQAALFNEGDCLSLINGEKPTRLVLVAGAPLREPVAWGGPIVMNTDEQLKQAFFELEDGTFIKK